MNTATQIVESETASVEEGSTLRHLNPINTPTSTTIKECVETALTTYFSNLDGQEAQNIYKMVLAEVEAPMLEKVLEHVRGNQTKAAECLGLNRGTLRKKLKIYGLL